MIAKQNQSQNRINYQNYSVMRKHYFILVFGLFAYLQHLSAQGANKDSINLVNKMNGYKGKLAQLQAQLPDRKKEMEQAATKAQEAADDNRAAANRLSNEPDDKKLARHANNTADDARDNARKARAASSDVEKLEKNIRDLSDKIAKGQKRLDKYNNNKTPDNEK